MKAGAVDRLEVAFGHRFRDEARMRRALTHPSFAHEHPEHDHYQRLEFLGDAVVGLCTTRLLYERYPDVPEGDLNDLRQRLVNTRTLGEVGRDMGLVPFVRLGAGESGKKNVAKKILADVVEAVLGALYLEAGLDACQATVERWLGPRIEGLREALADASVKNPINRLQEYTQARWKAVPDYHLHATGPAHDRRWVATVEVQGEALAEGEGGSQKDARKDAAHMALTILERRDAASEPT